MNNKLITALRISVGLCMLRPRSNCNQRTTIDFFDGCSLPVDASQEATWKTSETLQSTESLLSAYFLMGTNLLVHPAPVPSIVQSYQNRDFCPVGFCKELFNQLFNHKCCVMVQQTWQSCRSLFTKLMRRCGKCFQLNTFSLKLSTKSLI